MFWLKLLPILGGALLAGYLYHTTIMDFKQNEITRLNNKITELTEQKLACDLKTGQQELTISSLENSNRELTQSVNQITQSRDEVVAQRDQYLSIFRRHNLSELSYAKPGLIQSRINSGTQKIFDDLENYTRETQDEQTTTADTGNPAP